MSVHSISDVTCAEYFTSLCAAESEVQRQLKGLVSTLDNVPPMYIDPLQGAILAFLARSIQAKNILELGTFVGYGTLWLARALSSDGKITTCERDKRWWPIAADAFEKSGVSSQVHQEKCHAIESLQNWLNLDTPPVFDFIFIDADKSSIPVYVDACLPLLSPQGLLIIDNVWWQGKVLNSDDHQKRAEVLRQFNADLAKDARLDVVMLPISDGISMIRKKAFL
ncbi:MAG: O-methyltransferase [Gammaproteobacteria bacterium]|nr:O-methyltransferase [Gammaproteobacteria bacterium]MCD8542459.1 O-methyltransferase [Gammaproteobacteria bacterium]